MHIPEGTPDETKVSRPVWSRGKSRGKPKDYLLLSHYDMQCKWANGAVPRHYELQVKHYMSVMNIDVAYIACLFSNNENDFVWQKIERDLEEEENTILQLKDFWFNHVQKNQEPALVEKPDLVLRMLAKYYGPADLSEREIKLDAGYAEALEQITCLKKEKQEADAEVRRLDKQIKALYAPIAEQLGTCCSGFCDDAKGNQYRVSFKPLYRTGISKENLNKLKAQLPDVYEEYVETTESRVFKVVDAPHA